MSDFYGNKTDLSNSNTVVMNADEIDEKLRLMREKAVSEPVPNSDGFVIPPDDYDMTVVESNPAPYAEQETFAPELDEQILQPEPEPADELYYSSSEKAKHKKKVRRLVICAIIAAALVGLLVAVIIAKNARSNAEYDTCYENAEEYYFEGDYDKALEALRQAMSVKKTDDCLLLMSECYEAKNDFVNALAILDSSNTGDPKIKARIRELKKAQKEFENSNKVMIDGDEYSVETTSLDLSGRGLRSNDLSELQKLTELTSLKLNKNKIDSIGFLKPLKNLVSLDLSKNNIENISALSNLTSLKTLHLDGNKIESFEPLYGLKNLTTLTISDIKISKSQLKELKEALPNCIITSDEAENDVVEIKLGGRTFKSDVKELDLSSREINDISVLVDCTELETLNLSGNYISDISVLLDLPKLKSVNLANNNISDVRPLMSLTTIEYLNLSGNQISSIAALGELTGLEELSLKGNVISDFSPLSNLVVLDMLDLTGTGITDNSLSYLYKLKDLKKLSLDNNDISFKAYDKLKNELPNCTISHSEFKKISLGQKSFAPDATTVDASNLGLSDISAVAGFARVEKLDLSNNNISDVTPLYELSTLRELNLSGNSLSSGQKSALSNALPGCKINYGT